MMRNIPGTNCVCANKMFISHNNTFNIWKVTLRWGMSSSRSVSNSWHMHCLCYFTILLCISNTVCSCCCQTCYLFFFNFNCDGLMPSRKYCILIQNDYAIIWHFFQGTFKCMVKNPVSLVLKSFSYEHIRFIWHMHTFCIDVFSCWPLSVYR